MANKAVKMSPSWRLVGFLEYMALSHVELENLV